MRYGFVLPYGDAGAAADLAQEAEEAGWDGFFVWEPVWGYDAWILLAAAAMEGRTSSSDPELGARKLRPWAEAGVTWWIEAMWDTMDRSNGVDVVRKRIKHGPPKG